MHKPDWRYGYQEELEQYRADIRDYRRTRPSVTYQVGRRWKYVDQLTDREIDEVARVMATRAIERAINEWNAADGLRRYRP